MKSNVWRNWLLISGLVCLGACQNSPNPTANAPQGLEVKFLVGSALLPFCEQAATQFNQGNPQMDNGKPFYLKCVGKGSGEVLTTVVNLAQQLQQGTLPATAPDFPTLISTDGEIYHAQLKYAIDQMFPGQNYIPDIPDAPLLAHTPMVFMAPAEVAAALRKQPDIYKALLTAKTYKDLDASSQALPIYYVHTAPTHSNSGLQTLVAQFAAVSGKRPEQLTAADIQKYQGKVQEIQKKVTRYGLSTHSLAKDMVKNGPFWASVGSVYESSVIEANSNPQANNTTRYEAIYPQATFTSNMRAILPQAPWVSEEEKAAATKVVEYLRSPQAQQIATNLGLRPGIPGVELGAKFSPQFGVNPQATYDSLRAPNPQLVNQMLKSWQEFAKKPSQVVIVIDSSGSMQGNKLPSVQNTLNNYINNLGLKEKVILIDFDSQIRPPLEVVGTRTGKDNGLNFIAGLRAEGGTRLYDSTLEARNWLQKNLRPEAINAVVILTDGEDSGSRISLEQLQMELSKSSFNSDQRIAFFTIGYGKEGEFNPQVLEKIASLNGGYYRKGDPDTISTVMSNLQLEF